MRRRAAYAVSVGVGSMLAPGVALAQDEPGQFEPILNWVFYLAILIGVGFVVFVGFAILYYVLAVVARGRRYATQAAATPARPQTQAAPAPAPAAAAAAPAQAPAQQAAAPQAPAQQAPAQEAPAQAAPAQEAPAQQAPAQEAAPAQQPAPPAAAPADGGALPKIDPMNLPDGVDAVTRGRLKKLAVLQERGKAAPAELVEQLKPVLEEMHGGPIDVSAATAAPAPQQAPAEAASTAEAPAAEAPPAEAPPAEAQPAEAAPAEQAPAEEKQEAPAAQQEEAPAQEAPAQEAPAAADTGDLPRIDPMNLPDGIDAVTRGRLKKLAIFQERGQAPPADLVENLQTVLDRMKES